MAASYGSDTSRSSRQPSVRSMGADVISLQINLPQRDKKKLDIEEFLQAVNIDFFVEMDEDKQEEFLSHIDAIDLFDLLKEVDYELAKVKLEIYFLTDFLEQNNPKLLVGVKQRRSTVAHGRQMALLSRQSMSAASAIMGAPSSEAPTARKSMATAGMKRTTTVTEFKLNFKTKADMAEKSAIDIEKQVVQIEKDARREIKQLRADIEELRYRAEETEETSKNFMLHFMADEADLQFLEQASEKQLAHKLNKFTSNWFKNARGLMATMRLKINHLHDACAQYRSELITKSDLSKILSAVDFEQLTIKRDQLLHELEEKNLHMTSIKNMTGKSSMTMGQEKQAMMNFESQHKQISNRIVEIIKIIGKLENDIKIVDDTNTKDLQELEQLQEQQERYQAPSIKNYIDRKDELTSLEKEERMLRRKIHIMHMKVSNMQKQCRRQKEKGA